jgi:hypothetical protein
VGARRKVKPTRWLLLGLLLLASTGCARRDWVSDMLTFADVTGTWTGSYVCDSRSSGVGVEFGATFRQSGSRVTGTISSAYSRARYIELEGVVNGDVLSFTGRSLSVQATVDGDDMSGVLTGTAICNTYSKSPFDLRRESSGRPGARLP